MTEQKHDRIFLSYDKDYGIYTWEEKRFTEDDVEYIRADLVAKQLAEREKQIVMLREFAKLLRDYIPASAIGNMTVQEALAATQDLSGLVLCDAEPVWVAETTEEKQLLNGKPRRLFWECNEGVGTPLYKARKP